MLLRVLVLLLPISIHFVLRCIAVHVLTLDLMLLCLSSSARVPAVHGLANERGPLLRLGAGTDPIVVV
jgi:hypothetical protein